MLAAINGRSSQVTTKRVELAALVEIPDNMRFLGDAGRIRQVLLNLVGNAVKFTEAGAVTIRAYIAYGFDLPDHSLIRFDISDSGIGIAPDVLDPALPALRPGRWFHHPTVRWDRPGTRDLEATRGDARWSDRRPERGGRRAARSGSLSNSPMIDQPKLR